MNYTNDLFETLLFNPINESPISSSFPSNLAPDNNFSLNLTVTEYTVEEAFSDKTTSLNIDLTLSNKARKGVLSIWGVFGQVYKELKRLST